MQTLVMSVLPDVIEFSFTLATLNRLLLVSMYCHTYLKLPNTVEGLWIFFKDMLHVPRILQTMKVFPYMLPKVIIF